MPPPQTKRAPIARKPEPRRSSPTSIQKRKPPVTKGITAKYMEPLEEKEQEQKIEEEQVVCEAQVLTVESVEPQSHEVQLMTIPVKNFVNGEMANEEKEKPKEEQEEGPQQRRRMSSESSQTADHRRRPTRGDSEVKIEEILTRVFEDITTQPKVESKKPNPMKKSPAPVARRPPIPKPPAKPSVPRAAAKTTPAVQPTKKTAASGAPKKPTEPKAPAAPPKIPTPTEPAKSKSTTLEKKVTPVRTTTAPKLPVLPRRMTSTPIKPAAITKKAAPAKKMS